MKDVLKNIEGKQTVESVAEILNLKRQSAINLLSKLKKEGFVKVSGGRQQKRIYTISNRRILKKENEGMFDILNKYSKNKIIPPFIHEPHNKYCAENAIVDLAEFDDIRILANMLKLFNHVKNWNLIYSLAKKSGAERKIGALYEIAREFTKTRKMPERTRKLLLNSKTRKDFSSSSGNFKDIENIWKVKIPFNKKDLEALRND